MTRSALIVDDHPDIRKLIRMTMKAEGFELHEADNGEDAWRIARVLYPSIVLLDAMMPGSLDGYQVCEKIKTDTTLKLRTKVIMLTASENEEHVSGALEAGARGYILKGIGAAELLRTVHAVHQGESYVSPQLAARLLTTMRSHAPAPAAVAAKS